MESVVKKQGVPILERLTDELAEMKGKLQRADLKKLARKMELSVRTLERYVNERNVKDVDLGLKILRECNRLVKERENALYELTVGP